MKKCCATCGKQFILERYDYSQNGCKHSYEQGFACGVFMGDGIVVHMIGTSPEKEQCEEWVER